MHSKRDVVEFVVYYVWPFFWLAIFLAGLGAAIYFGGQR